MKKNQYNDGGTWEERENYKSYRRNKMKREEDIDYFKCACCAQFVDSFDESDSNGVCVDCFYPEDLEEEDDIDT